MLLYIRFLEYAHKIMSSHRREELKLKELLTKKYITVLMPFSNKTEFVILKLITYYISNNIL